MDTYNGLAFAGFIGDKPELIHLETHTFKVQIKNADGSAFNLSGFATAECAVNNTFDHVQNELMAYAGSEDCTITDAAAGEIELTLNCNTLKFGQVVKFNSAMAFLEVNLFDSVAKMTRVLLDRVECRPHVRDQEGAPVSGDPGYYNKTEVDALISGVSGAVESVNSKTGAVMLSASDVGAIADPETAGTTGQVLTQTAAGPKWQNLPTPESGMPIVALTSTAITPADGKVFTRTLQADDDFTIITSALTSTRQIQFELHLTQPGTAVTFTLPSNVLWPDGDSFAAANTPPEMTGASTLYCLVFRWDGAQLLGNLAYSKAVSA